MRELRKRMKLSQTELAKLMGMGQLAITHYETGKTQPSTDILIKIVAVLGTNSAYLLGEIDYSGKLTERDSAMLRDLHSRGESPDVDDFLDVWLDHLPKQK